MPESAIERLRRLAGLPPASDATRVAPKPKPVPRTISPLPVVESETQIRARRGREAKAEDRRLGTTYNETPAPAPKPDRALVTPPGPLFRKQDADATAVRVITPPDEAQKFGYKERPLTLREKTWGTGGIMEPGKPWTKASREVPAIPTIGEQSPEHTLKPDYLRGLAREKQNAANYRNNPAAFDVASRLEDDARIAQQPEGFARRFATSAIEGNTLGLAGRLGGSSPVGQALDPSINASRQALARLRNKKAVTRQELTDSGVLDPDERLLSGLPGEGDTEYDGSNQAGSVLGGFAGIVGPIAAERALVKGVLRTARPLASEATGFSRVGDIATRIARRDALVGGYANPATLAGKMAQQGTEFAVPGAIEQANENVTAGRRAGEGIGEGMLLNAGFGGAFPVGGKLAGEAMQGLKGAARSGVAREFAAVARNVPKALSDTRVKAEGVTPEAPRPAIIKPAIDKLREMAKPVVQKAIEIDQDPRAKTAAMIGAGAYAVQNIDKGKYAVGTDEDEKMNPLAVAGLAAGTIAAHGHGGLKALGEAAALGKIWEHGKYRIQKNAHDSFDLYNLDNEHIMSSKSLSDAYDAVQAATSYAPNDPEIKAALGNPPSAAGSHLHDPQWDYEAAHRAGNLDDADYEVYKEGWKFNHLPTGAVEIISPANQVVGMRLGMRDAMNWLKASGPKQLEQSWTVKPMGGLYDVYDHMGEYQKSFADPQDAYDFVEKQGKQWVFAPEDKSRLSPRSGKGVLGRTWKERVGEYLNAGMKKHAENLQRHMEQSAVEKPLVHATRADFPAFTQGELGFHLTPDPAAGERRLPVHSQTSAVGHIMPLWASIKNPIRLRDPGHWNEAILFELRDMGLIDTDELYRVEGEVRDLQNDPKTPGATFAERQYNYTKPLRDLLKSKGYDGIVYENRFEGGGDSYIALDPEQLKSVTGNNGNFDPKVAATIGAGALGVRLLTDNDGPPSEDEKKHAQMLQGLAFAAGTIAARGHEGGPGLSHALEGRLGDLVSEFRELHENNGPHMQEGLERLVREERDRLQGAHGYEETLPKGVNRRSNKPKTRSLVGLRSATLDRYEKALMEMRKHYNQTKKELESKARELRHEILSAHNASLEDRSDVTPQRTSEPPDTRVRRGGITGRSYDLDVSGDKVSKGKKALALVGATAVGAKALQEADDDDKGKIAAAAALGAAMVLRGRPFKPRDLPTFFSRADKFFDEGGLEKHIANRPTLDGVKMKGVVPQTATEWKQMLFGENLNDVERKELQIRLGEQLDIAEEEGRTLTKADVRAMLADNPIKYKIHVVGGEALGPEHEWKTNPSQRNPFEEWTDEGGDDYRSIVITAEPTKRYRDIPPPPEPGDPGVIYLKESPDREGWDAFDSEGNKIADGAAKDDAKHYAREWWINQGRQGQPRWGDASAIGVDHGYQEGHYGEGGWLDTGTGMANVIGHIRIKTRHLHNGKTVQKVLHVEEVQSTLGQKIAKHGADGSPERAAKLAALEKELADTNDQITAIKKAGGKRPASEVKKKHRELTRRIKDLKYEAEAHSLDRAHVADLMRAREVLIRERKELGYGGGEKSDADLKPLYAKRRKILDDISEWDEAEGNTPALPLAGSMGEYTDVLLGTALDVAAREGHERIIWTGGLHQTKRFNDGLREVSKIMYNPKTRKVVAFTDDGELKGLPPTMSPVEMDSYFGQNITKQLTEGAAKETWQGDVWHKVEGENVSIGSKGMTNYYDHVVPKWFEKRAKQLGVKIEFTPSRIEDAVRSPDTQAQDIVIGDPPSHYADWVPINNEPEELARWQREGRPLDISAEELDYRVAQARDEGHSANALMAGRRVQHAMETSGMTFQEAVQTLLRPEQRRWLANLLGENTYSPTNARADTHVTHMGFDVPPELVRRIFEGQRLYANPLDPKLILDLYKQHPTVFAGGAMIGAGAALADFGDKEENRKLEWTGRGMIGLGALHMIGAHKTRSGLPLYQDVAGRAGGGIVKALKDAKVGNMKGRHILDWISHDILASPELRRAADDFERDRAKAAAISLEFKARLKRLGDVANRGVTDEITKETWEPNVKNLSPEEARAMIAAAEDLRNEFTYLGWLEVKAGTLHIGQFTKYDREYMPYLYPEMEALHARGIGKGPTPTSVPRVRGHKSRTDIPMAERQKMGQIREADYLAEQGLRKGYNNLAAAKLFSALTMIPGSLHPEYEKAVRAVMAANRSGVQSQVRRATNALQKIRAEAAGDLDRGQFAGYRTLPNSKGLGVLSGAVVRNDIAAYLEGLPAFGSRTLVDDLFMGWKKIHTVWNPGTHVGNFVSNIVTVHMKGLPIHKIPGALIKAGGEIRRYGKYARALTEAGVMDQNLATMDYGAGMFHEPRSAMENLRQLAGRTLPTTKQKLAEMEIEPHSQNKALRAGRWADNKLATAYNLEDNWFRVALLQQVTKSTKAGGLGLNMAQGVEYVRHHMGDFRTRSAALRLAKWYSPFVMYPAKMVPHMLGSVIEHPFRWMTLAGTWGALDQLGAYATGEGDSREVRKRIKSGQIDEMDMREDERPARGFGYLIPGPVQAPIKRHNMKFATDISRYTPFSSLSGQAAPGSLASALSSRIPAIAAPGGPLADLYARNINTDPFTGERFVKLNDTPMEKVKKLGFTFVGNQILPSALSWHLPRVYDDYRNNDPEKMAIDAMGFIGARPRTVIPGQRALQDKYWYEDSKEEASRELRKKSRLAAKSPKRQRELADDYREKMQRLAKEYVRRNTRPK